MKDKNLIKLVERAARGDKKAFVQLCEVKARDILYMSTRFMRNAHDGEDAAQEVLIYMQQHIHELKHPEAFGVWLYRVIHGVCIGMIRKNTKLSDAIATAYKQEEEGRGIEAVEEWREEFLPYDFVENRSRRKSILEVLDTLPDRHRMCIFLYYFEGMKYEEIAGALEISVKDVNNAMMRGRGMLKRQLEKNPEVRKFLGKTYAVAPIPVLTRLLRLDAEECISEESVKRLLGTVAGSGTGGFLVWKGWKLLIAGVAAAGAVGLGVTAYQNRSQSSPQAGIQAETTGIKMQENQPREQTVPEAAVEIETDGEMEIRTLEDMIGVDEAAMLRAFVKAEDPDRQEILAFLDEIGMGLYESVWNGFRKWEYSLFTLRRQDKLLMVILEQELETDHYGVAFKFTHGWEELPENIEIMIFYYDWK